MKRSYDKEMMDLPGQPRELLEGDLDNLRFFNRRLGGYRSVLAGLEQLTRKQKLDCFSLLDVGTGGGDVPIRIADWAHQRGIKASIVALDPESVTVRFAAQKINPTFIPQTLQSTVIPAKVCPEHGQRAGIQQGEQEDSRHCGISVVRGDGFNPPFRPASFDVVLASQLLHHFSEDQIVVLLQTWSKLARKAIIVSDLVRHPVPYYGIRLIAKAYTRNLMTRTDAPLSVRRAFTQGEWRQLFRRAEVGRFQTFSAFPFRITALFSLAG